MYVQVDYGRAQEVVRQPVILLVEDHPDTATTMVKLLTNWGYHVLHAKTLHEAYVLAELYAYDLLISDAGLPDGCGVELPQRLPAGGPRRSILLTAYGHLQEKSKEAGFDAHMTKPFNPARLAQTIQRLLHEGGLIPET